MGVSCVKHREWPACKLILKRRESKMGEIDEIVALESRESLTEWVNSHREVSLFWFVQEFPRRMAHINSTPIIMAIMCRSSFQRDLIYYLRGRRFFWMIIFNWNEDQESVGICGNSSFFQISQFWICSCSLLFCSGCRHCLCLFPYTQIIHLSFRVLGTQNAECRIRHWKRKQKTEEAWKRGDGAIR